MRILLAAILSAFALSAQAAPLEAYAKLRALEAAGRKPELLTLPGEDHWLSRGETRQQMLNATVAFLERHNPPK